MALEVSVRLGRPEPDDDKEARETLGVHRWDGYVEHEPDALRILFTLSDLCNRCHGPMTEDECPCAVMEARNQALAYLKKTVSWPPQACSMPQEDLRRVIDLFEAYDRQWWVPTEQHERDPDLGIPLFKVNPAWHEAKALAGRLIADWEQRMGKLSEDLDRLFHTSHSDREGLS